MKPWYQRCPPSWPGIESVSPGLAEWIELKNRILRFIDLEKKPQRAMLGLLIMYNFCLSEAFFTIKHLGWSVVKDLVHFSLVCKM